MRQEPGGVGVPAGVVEMEGGPDHRFCLQPVLPSGCGRSIAADQPGIGRGRDSLGGQLTVECRLEHRRLPEGLGGPVLGARLEKGHPDPVGCLRPADRRADMGCMAVKMLQRLPGLFELSKGNVPREPFKLGKSLFGHAACPQTMGVGQPVRAVRLRIDMMARGNPVGLPVPALSHQRVGEAQAARGPQFRLAQRGRRPASLQQEFDCPVLGIVPETPDHPLECQAGIVVEVIGNGGDQPVNAGFLLPEGDPRPGQLRQIGPGNVEHGLRLVGSALPQEVVEPAPVVRPQLGAIGGQGVLDSVAGKGSESQALVMPSTASRCCRAEHGPRPGAGRRCLIAVAER